MGAVSVFSHMAQYVPHLVVDQAVPLQLDLHGTGFGTSPTSFSSTLSGTATPALNGTLVECFGPSLDRDARNMVGGNILQLTCQFIILFEFSAFVLVTLSVD